jgi:hypothetical protein
MPTHFSEDDVSFTLYPLPNYLQEPQILLITKNLKNNDSKS